MTCSTCFKSQLSHSKPRKRMLVQTKPEKCRVCELFGTEYYGWDVKYCPICHAWICDKCKNDPVRRARAAYREKILRRKK